MTEMRKAWFSMMMAKLDTDEDGVRDYMRQMQKKSVAVPNRKKGGFAARPDIASEAGKKSRRKAKDESGN